MTTITEHLGYTPGMGGVLEDKQTPTPSSMEGRGIAAKLLKCPDCGGVNVATTNVQLCMVNTGEHYSHSVKMHDAISRALCLDCPWTGIRKQLTSD